MSLSDDIRKEDEVSELRSALKKAQQSAYKAKRASEVITEAVYSAAYAAAIASGPVKQPVVKNKKDSRKAKSEVALIHATDWQNGKKSVSYGMKKCADRIEQLTAKVIELTEIQRAHHPVRECVVMFGGDMVEGITIYPGQAWEIDAHLF